MPEPQREHELLFPRSSVFVGIWMKLMDLRPNYGFPDKALPLAMASARNR